MAGEEVKGGALEVTPTWAVAVVCSIFVLASFGIERAIHYTGKWLRNRGEKSLKQALDKIKEELMLLGFISLLLAVFQPVIAGICMPRSFIQHMLPCKYDKHILLAGERPHNSSSPNSTEQQGGGHNEGHSRKLLYDVHHLQRLLSESAESSSKCFDQEKVPFISAEGLHKLHIFIFVLALVHVGYSCITLLLGRYKVHAWNAWEKKAQADMSEKLLGEVKTSFKMSRQNTFLQKHANPIWISSDVLSWIVSFFRQFGRSVTSIEYKTLRLGFIRNHKLDNKFDFHRYVLRVLESDFKKVVGISFYLWTFVVLFLLLNVNGWHTYFWISFLPLGLLVIIGAKLQHIIMELAVEIAEEQKDQGNVVVVNLRDELFWFNRPKLILTLIHFILFQNAFELAFFFWIWAAFGFKSCFMDNLGFVITRIVIGVVVQVLCSYSTLPLYALVTQMGKQYQFGEEIHEALTNLRTRAKRKSVHGGVSVPAGPETETEATVSAPSKPKPTFKGLAAAAVSNQGRITDDKQEPRGDLEMGTRPGT